MEKKKLIKDLQQNYGLEIKTITDAPRGFVAETFFVEAGEQRLFLKIRNNDANRYENSLAVLRALNAKQISHIPKLVITTNSEVGYGQDDGRYVSMFEVIPGQLTSSYDAKELVKILVNIHKQTNLEEIKVEKEVFNISYHSKYLQILEEADNSGFDKVVSLKKDFSALFAKLYQELSQLSQNLQSEELQMYLTHGDAHNNVMVDGTNHYLVDWDSIMLAPLERDLWFFVENKEVVDIYTQEFRNFVINPQLIRFYRLSRLFSDLNGFLEVIRDTKVEQVREENYQQLNESVFEWLLPLLNTTTP